MGKRKLFMKNGGMVLEELNESFNGKCYPIRSFTLREIKTGTDKYDFRHLIVWDSHYRMYQGFLQGRQVSIKRYEDAFPGGIESIVTDIAVASNMNVHKNNLKLLGCCLETRHPMLVYEFVGGTVLAKFLNSHAPHTSLEWKNRVKIAMDIANAIAFLHTGFDRPIVHRDIKASSVVVDRDNVARLFDYSRAVPIPRGAPDDLSEEGDVYLFGLFLLHVLVGYNVSRVARVGDDGDEYVIFPGRGEYKEERRRLMEIVDPRIVNERMVGHAELVALWRMALWCIADVGEERPTMVEVGKGVREIYRSIPFPSHSSRSAIGPGSGSLRSGSGSLRSGSGSLRSGIGSLRLGIGPGSGSLRSGIGPGSGAL